MPGRWKSNAASTKEVDRVNRVTLCKVFVLYGNRIYLNQD
jgi:hypothetical protein